MQNLLYSRPESRQQELLYSGLGSKIGNTADFKVSKNDFTPGPDFRLSRIFDTADLTAFSSQFLCHRKISCGPLPRIHLLLHLALLNLNIKTTTSSAISLFPIGFVVLLTTL